MRNWNETAESSNSDDIGSEVSGKRVADSYILWFTLISPGRLQLPERRRPCFLHSGLFVVPGNEFFLLLVSLTMWVFLGPDSVGSRGFFCTFVGRPFPSFWELGPRDLGSCRYNPYLRECNIFLHSNNSSMCSKALSIIVRVWNRFLLHSVDRRYSTV